MKDEHRADYRQLDTAPTLTRIRKLQDRRYRDQHRLFFIEGVRNFVAGWPRWLPLLPGGNAHATIKALYESNGVSYEELVEGARFEILEGPHVVGYGEVVRRGC